MCICIAVIHHLSTADRRLAAIKELIRIIKPGGRVLISVWALEQDFSNTGNRKSCDVGKSVETDSKHESHYKASSHGTDFANQRNVGGHKPNMGNVFTSSSCNTDDTSEIYPARFLSTPISSGEKSIQGTQVLTENNTALKEHLFKLKVNASRGYFEQQDLLIPWNYRGQRKPTNTRNHDEEILVSAGEVPKVYQRFYHVFKENELMDECKKLDYISVVRCYYDKGNWCVELEKVR